MWQASLGKVPDNKSVIKKDQRSELYSIRVSKGMKCLNLKKFQ